MKQDNTKCFVCGADCRGVAGLIGKAGKAKVACLKHYRELRSIK